MNEGSSDADSYAEDYWDLYGTNLDNPEQLAGYIADFDFLKNLGNSWDTVRVKYTPTYMKRYWGDRDPVSANVLAVPIIEQDLARTAKELVGGEGWALEDRIEDQNETASGWVLNVERKGSEERVECLKHIGLHDYLAPCDGCNRRTERFHLEPAGDGVVKFVGEECGKVVSTSIFQEESDLVLTMSRSNSRRQCLTQRMIMG